MACKHEWIGVEDGVICRICEKKLTVKEYLASLKKKKKEKMNENTD